jgi:T5SS/PEP-CTERM-associated repeat protein/autotransporter-associated beta strand protein
MKKIHLFAALLCLGEVTSHFVFAQDLVVDGGTTNITSGINFYDYTLVGGATSDNQLNVLNGGTLLTNSGSLTVGQSGSSNSLVISNEGRVANTSGAIGANSSSSNNSVLVTGTNSTWTNSGTLYVGYAGSSNSLVISNGATVANTAGSIGDRFTSSGNSVLVTGTGSRWTTSENLYVGYSGSSNSLVISNGATVASAAGFVGLDSTSSNNSVLVTGSNSLWTNLGDLRMGNGASNRLVISSGGKVVSSNGYVGVNTTDVPSVDSNHVLVTDAGSSWSNSAQLFVGAGPFAGGNSLVVSNGGVVYGGVDLGNGDGVLVGSYASNNSVMVDGSGSRLFVAGGMMVGKGGNGWANENSLTVSSGGQVISLDNIGMTIGFAQSSNNSVLVTGTGSLLSFNDLAVGGNYEGSGTLTVSDGASIVATNFIDISYQSPGTLNVGALNGSDTAGTITASHIRVGFLSTNGSLNFNQVDALTLTSHLSGMGTINQFGSGTTILAGSNSRFTGVTTITNGQLQFGDGVTAGGAPVAGNMSNNASLVFSPASTDTYVVRGNISGSGRLTEIGTGTTVLSGNNSDFTGLTRIKQGTLQFGDGVTAGGAPVAGSISNNASLIFAPSSGDTYTVSGNISGSGRFTQIGNGTTVLSGNNTYTGGTVIANGLLATTSTNALGTGFVTVTNTGKLAPGVDDALVIAGDFTFTTGSAFVWQLLGNTNGGAGNFTPAVDLSANNLSVDLGSTFELFFGPSVDASDAFWAPGATNSWTIFTGTSPSLGAGTNFSLDWAAGSMTNGFDLANFSLGTNATGLVLNYDAPRYLWNTNAGDWTNAANWIDNTVPGAANDAYIDNGGLALVNGDAAAANNLYVGSTNSGNNLVISNGGRVENFFGYIGFETNSSNNSALVTGRNSAWNNSSDLYVGLNGSSNSLVISNGGSVLSENGIIGNYNSNNSVLVTGSSSLWMNTYDLFVGTYGSSNGLVISNGGTVMNRTGYIGPDSTSSNNIVTVAGAGSAWMNTGDLYVGYLGSSGNSLVISNEGSVVSGSAIIGTYDSSNNIVTVTGTNSAWTNMGDLYVGYLGSSNSLVISNGGAVVNSDGYIGSEANSSNNSVLVTGTSSAWTNTGSLIVGFYGSSNSLVISNGGNVESRNGTIGFDSTSSNNSVLVTGTNSAWTNTNELTVGYQGSSNSLVISNGGSVASLNGRIGIQSSSNNVLVTGTGSAWTNTTELLIGNTGSDNSLVISNEGTVVTGMCLIGDQSTASNNSVLVTGTNSAWTNTGDLFVGYYGSGNSLVISNGGAVVNSDGYIGFYADSSNNSVVVTGSNSLWTNSNDLVVGNSGSSNSLVISDGGTMASGMTRISYDPNSSNNSVLVTGAGSTWTNSSDLLVGADGSGSSLVISNGGTVANTYGHIGGGPTSMNNSVLVTGSSSLWMNSEELYVGGSGSGNSLVITNGGTVASSNDGYIGLYRTSSNNSLLVTGSNSLWTNSGDLNVGYYGSGNSLVITNGGTVVSSGDGYIGVASTSSNNSVLVTGSTSLWTNANELNVGNYGSGNSLVISNGGTVANRDGFIGFYADSSNNSVLVTGSGSTWTNSDTLFVGVEGTGNTLTVAEGGTIAAANIVIAASNGSSGTLNVGRFGANGAASTITAPTIAFGAGTGVINFNQSNTVTVSSVISGAGMVNQLGTGWTVLSGANTYTGPTTVSAGTLVAQSQTALGTGGVTLLGGTLELQSQLDIGSLLWDGAAVIAMPGAGNGQFLNVTGLLKLTNGVNNFNLAGAALPRSPVKLLSSTNLPTLSTDDFGVLGLGSYTLSIDGNTLYLTAQDISYQSFAISPNQVSVAKALDTFIGAPGDRGTVSAALDTLAISQYPAAFEQLMPSQYASLPSMVFNVANALNSSLFQRMWAVRSSGRGFSSSGMNLAPMQGEMGGTDDMGVFAINPSKETRWGTFVDGNGVFANASSTGSVQNYRSQSGGVSTGAAYSWNEALATGVYVGYQGLQAEYDSGRTIDNAVRFGVFGTYEVEDFYFNALVGGAYHGYTVSRNIDFGGLDRTATGRPGAGEFNLALGTGYDFQAGDLTFGPFTTLQYTYLGVQGFTETGADALDLDVSPYDSSSMLYTLGAQAAYNWKLSKDVIITPVAFAGWQHEFLQNGYTINSSFATGGPAAPFNYNTSSPARDNFYGGAGVTVSLGERWQATFIYSASAANEDNSSQNLYLSAGYKF